jgi:hypothetical protein
MEADLEQRLVAIESRLSAIEIGIAARGINTAEIVDVEFVMVNGGPAKIEIKPRVHIIETTAVRPAEEVSDTGREFGPTQDMGIQFGGK